MDFSLVFVPNNNGHQDKQEPPQWATLKMDRGPLQLSVESSELVAHILLSVEVFINKPHFARKLK